MKAERGYSRARHWMHTQSKPPESNVTLIQFPNTATREISNSRKLPLVHLQEGEAGSLGRMVKCLNQCRFSHASFPFFVNLKRLPQIPPERRAMFINESRVLTLHGFDPSLYSQLLNKENTGRG